MQKIKWSELMDRLDACERKGVKPSVVVFPNREMCFEFQDECYLKTNASGEELPYYNYRMGYHAFRIAIQKEETTDGDIMICGEEVSYGAGVKKIAEERDEQVYKHGYVVGRDVEVNSQCQLVGGALGVLSQDTRYFPGTWNIELCDKMMKKSYKERLRIAGALIAAEIDRLEEVERRALK